MTLPDTLPDVPAEDWFQHQAQQFQQQAQAQIDSLHSGAAMDAITAPLQAMPQLPTVQPPQVQLPQIQGPPNPIDAIFGGGAPAAPAPAAPPPIAPAPAAPPPAAPAPVAPPAAPPVAPPAPTPGAPDQSWFGDALTHVANAGGDVQQFASDLGSRVDPTVTDPSQIYGHAITAAANAGADVSQFAQNFQPPPAPTPANLPGADQLSAIFDQPAPSQAAARSSAGLGTGEISSTGAPAGAIDSSSRAAFAQSFAPYAQYISQQTGIAPDLVTAMAGSESNFGKAPGNELFGIKALPGQASQSLATHEGEYGGTNMNQDFAAYQTPLDSANAYISLITKHYPGAMGAQTAQDLAHGLKQGGYYTAAEDEYANSLAGIQKQVSGPVNDALGGQQQMSGPAGTDWSVPTSATQAQQQQSGKYIAPVENQRQFENEAGLSAADAYSACGPVAAAAFAKTFGRNPTPAEAIDLAKQVGWTSASGMAGIGSEQALLNKMGVSTHLTQGVDWDQVKNDAQSGNPVIISMGGHGEGHYIYVDGYDPSTGAFHGGESTGATLKGGQDWVTPADLSRMGWSPESALYADNPASPRPSPTATTTPNPPVTNSNVITDKAQQVQQAVQDVGTQATTGAQNLLNQLNPNKPPAPNQPPPGTPQAPQAPQQAGFTQGSQPPTPITPPPDTAPTATNPLDQFKQQIGDAFANLLGPIVGGASQAGQTAASTAQAAVNQLSQPSTSTSTTTATPSSQTALPPALLPHTPGESDETDSAIAALHPDLSLSDNHIADLLGQGAQAVGGAIGSAAQAVGGALGPAGQTAGDLLGQAAQPHLTGLLPEDVRSGIASQLGLLTPEGQAQNAQQQQLAASAQDKLLHGQTPTQDERDALTNQELVYGGVAGTVENEASKLISGLRGNALGGIRGLDSGVVARVLGGTATEADQAVVDAARTAQAKTAPTVVSLPSDVADRLSSGTPTDEDLALVQSRRNPDPSAAQVGDTVSVRPPGQSNTNAGLVVASGPGGVVVRTPDGVEFPVAHGDLNPAANAPPPDIATGGVEQLPNYLPGTPEANLEAEARASRESSPDGLAHVDLASVQGNPFSPDVETSGAKAIKTSAGGMPNLDVLRALSDANMGSRDWYIDAADGGRQIVGEDNLPELFTNLGITSMRTTVDQNVYESLNAMLAVRRAEQTALANGTDVRQAVMDAIEARGPNGADITGLTQGAKRKGVQNAYDTGTAVSGDPKTPSYFGNFVSAGRRLFDPRVTNDVWSWRGGGNVSDEVVLRPDKNDPTKMNRDAIHEKAAANSDVAYRFLEAAYQELAREKGLQGHQIQATVWAGTKNLAEKAPDLWARYQAGDFMGAINDAIARGNVFTGLDKGDIRTAFENPKVQRVLDQARSEGIDLTSPGPLQASQMSREFNPGPRSSKLASNETYREAGRVPYEAAAPVTGLGPRSVLDSVGYDPTTQQIPWIAAPHRVETSGDQAFLHLPGGRSDTARYLGSAFADAQGADHFDMHYPDYRAPDYAGHSVQGTPDEINALHDALDTQGVQHFVGPSGRSIQIPHAFGNEPGVNLLQRIIQAGQDAGIDKSRLTPYTGVTDRVGQADYARNVGVLGPTYGASGAGRPGLQERALDQLRAASAGAQPGTATSGARGALGRFLGDTASGLATRQEGSADPAAALRLGIHAASGAGAGLYTYNNTDPNDPNRWAKVAAATLGGVAAPEVLGRGLRAAGIGGDVAATADSIAREAADRGVDLSKPGETTPAVETAAAKILDHVDQRAPGLGQNYADTAPTHKEAVAQLSSDLSRFSKTTKETPKFTADGKPNNLAANDVETAGKARANQTRLANGDTVRVRSPDALGKMDNATVVSADPKGNGYAVITDAGERRYVQNDDVYPTGQTARRLAGTPTAPAPKAVEGQEQINMSDADQLARLRLQQFPEHLRQTIADAAKDVGWANANRRGVMPDAVVANQAKLIAADKSFTQMLMDRPPGSAFNADQMLAMQNAVGGTGARVYDLAAKINAGDTSEATMANWLHEGDRLRQLVAVAEGGRAEMGRGLRVFRQTPQLIDLAPEQALAEMTKTLGGKENLLRAAQDYEMLQRAQTSPAQLAAFWGGLQKGPPRGIKGVGEWITALRYGSMISGLPTAERVGVGGAINAIYGFARDGGISLVGDTIHAAKGDIPLTSIGHTPSAMFKGAVAGAMDSFHGFGQIMKHGISDWRAQQGELPVDIASRLGRENAAVRGAGYSLSFFGRVHQGLNEIAQRTAFNMRLYQRAAELAQSKGYFGKTEAEFIDNFVKNPSAPGYQAAFHDAMEYGRVAANRGELGNLGLFMQNVRHIPVAGQFILPFARVAYGIGSRMVDLTPIGAAGTALDIARTGGRYARATSVEDVEGIRTMTGGRLSGVRPIQQRVADNLLGSAIFGLSMYEALNSSENADGSWSPNLTGAGPTSPEARQQLESTGWQPYSIKVGGHYVPMRMLGAFMGPMGIAADMAEAYRYAKPKAGEDAPSGGDIARDAVNRLGRFATNETYLQSLADTINAAEDPTRYGTTWATNQASSFVPFGAAGRSVEQMTDPYQRATNLGNPLMQAGERAASNIPGLAGTLPTRNDVLGRPMENQFGAGWLPANISAGRRDPTLDALDAAGVTVPRMDPVVSSRNGVTQVRLSEAEQRQAEKEQGDLIQQYVGTMLENPNFQSYSADQRAQLLQHAVSAARSQSQNQAVGRALQQDPTRRLPAHKVVLTAATTSRVPLPTPSR